MQKHHVRFLSLVTLSCLLIFTCFVAPLSVLAEEDELAVNEDKLEKLRNLSQEDALVIRDEFHVSLAEVNFRAAIQLQQAIPVPAFSPDAQDNLNQVIPTQSGDQALIDILKNNVLNELPLTYALVELAEEEGLELSEEDEEQIEEVIISFKKGAASQGLDYEEFLELQFGPGITEEQIRRFVSNDLLKVKYLEQKYQSFEISEEDLEKEYESQPEMYDLASLYIVKLNPELSDRKLEKAEKTLKQQKSHEDFLKAVSKFADDRPEFLEEAGYETIEELLENESLLENVTTATLDADSGAWVFDPDRTAGDAAILTLGEDNYAFYFLGRQRDEGRNYNSRHILIKLKGEQAEDKEIALATVEAIQAAYEEDPGTDHFASLAQKYSEDPGSAENGGLYEDIAPGSFVAPYEEFCLAEDREEGDIVLALYEGDSYAGYHLIYFHSLEDLNWKRQCDSSLRQAAIADFLLQIQVDNPYTVNEEVLKYFLVSPLAHEEPAKAENSGSEAEEENADDAVKATEEEAAEVEQDAEGTDETADEDTTTEP